MRVVSLVNAETFTDPADGQEYTSTGGVFDLPEKLGTELTTHHVSLWREQTAHEAQIATEKLEELRNPHNVAPALADLRDRVAALEAAIGQLMQSAVDEPKRSTRTRKAATAE